MIQSRLPEVAELILHNLVRKFPGLVIQQDRDGYDLEVPGADLVDWLTDELHAVITCGNATELIELAQEALPDAQEAPELPQAFWSEFEDTCDQVMAYRAQKIAEQEQPVAIRVHQLSNATQQALFVEREEGDLL